MNRARRRTGFLVAALAVSTAVPGSACAQANAAERGDGETAAVPAARVAARAAAARILDRTAASIASSQQLRGMSGSVQAFVLHVGDQLPLEGALPNGVTLHYIAAGLAAPADTFSGTPAQPGVWTVLLRMGDVVRSVPDVNVFTSVPLAQKRAGKIDTYLVGTWPNEGRSTDAAHAYAPPAGLVQVTPANVDMHVSQHLRLGDFLTKGQNDVWPKYVALNPRVVDKLELTLAQLESAGHAVHHVGVISAFRTPWYNANGGSTAGRGDLSRHMYGDAIDLYIDNDRNGRMDDLNGDGRVDRKDAAVIAAAAESVELQHHDLVGGIGIYNPNPGAHSGFVHIDARGTRARW